MESGYKIDTSKLNSLGIYELRNLARALHVPRPTTLARDVLIAEINKYITESAPVPVAPRGRPPRAKAFDVSEILAGNHYKYDHILEEPDTIPLGYQDPQNPCVRSATPVRDSCTAEGYIHIVTRGHGILISSCLNSYFVPLKIITENKLETGDRVEILAVWNNQENRFVASEILKVERLGFDKAQSIRPHKSSGNKVIQFKLGQRIIISSLRHYNRVDRMAEHHQQLGNLYKIAFIIEESDDCVEYLRESGVDEVYLIAVDFSVKKQLMLALYTLFTAKHHAMQGKDVILGVDSLNKMFRLYNSSVSDRNTLDIDHLSMGALTDLKLFFMAPKQIKDGGSLTMVSYATNPTTETEKYVIGDFLDLANVHYQIPEEF